MQAAHRRHDMSDKVWELLEPHLPGEKEPEASLPVITEIFLMQFFGSCEQVRSGEICRLIMGTGKIPVAVFVDGEIAACGKDYSKFLFLNQILNGS